MSEKTDNWMRDVEQAHRDYLNDPERQEYVIRIKELEAERDALVGGLRELVKRWCQYGGHPDAIHEKAQATLLCADELRTLMDEAIGEGSAS